MGFRVQKSFRVAKGVRLNLSKSGLGVSVGVPGLRYSVHSSGRRTASVGVPGSGVRYQVTKRGGGGRSRTSVGEAPLPTRETLPKPGLFAPKAEKALHKAIEGRDVRAIVAAGDEHPEHRTLAYALAGFLCFESNPVEARRLLEAAFASGEDPHDDPLAQKYIGGSRTEVGIARGVTASLTLDRDAVGLALAELQQASGDPAAAIETVERLEPSTHAAVSLAELYSISRRHQDVVDLTEGIANSDDATSLLCVFRGGALHELGYHDAALAAFKEALRSRSRAAEIRHLALSERSRTLEAMGKRAMARKDLERILAEDSHYEGLHERIATLAERAVVSNGEPNRMS